MLILHQLEPWPWWLGGLGVGVVSLLLLWLGNQRLGISTGFENLCGLVLRTPYFARSEVASSQRWRLPFLAGLVLGGFLSALAAGGWAPFWDLGMLDARLALGPGAKLAWMFAGGLLIGFGTRMAGGCTSGHGIFGIANLERASFESTLSFVLAGMLTSNLIHRVLLA